MRSYFRLCRVNWGFVTGSKKCRSCMVFLVTLFMKGVGIFDKVVDGCGLSDSLEDIWGIL